MPRGRRAARATGARSRYALLALVAALASAGAVYLLVSDDGPDPGAERDVVLPDVHGVAASPTERGVVIVATHQGLMRHAPGEGWAPVGGARDDFMGFTMHPTDGGTFWTSGHPAGGGNMGVRQSTDGGASWRTLWAEPVDLHAMAVSPADPDRLWGWWQGRVLRSDDAGATWAPVGQGPVVRAFAGSPASRDVVLAATGTGIVRSVDGGATWAPLSGIPAFGVAVAPTDAQVAYAGGDGALWTSTDGGATWTDLPLPQEGTYAYLAVSRLDPALVVAATYQAGVFLSEDGGRAWRVLTPGR